MKRVDVDRVEPHRGDARQLRGPVRDRPGEGRKQIVDAQPFRHRPVLCGCAKRHCARWHNARWHNASWDITPEVSRRHTAQLQERICRTELPPIRGDREVPSVIGGIQHRNRQSATRTSSDCSPMRLPGINIGAAAYIPPRGIWYGSGKGFDRPFPRAIQDRAVADSCPLKRTKWATVPGCGHFMFKSGYLLSQIDTRRRRSATATSAPATAPRSAAGSGGSRWPARRRSRRAAPRPRRTACRRSGTPGAIRSRTRSAPTSPAIR